MSRDILRTLGSRLDEQSAVLARLDSYYRGEQPLSYLAPSARTALAGRIERVSVAIPRLVVGSLTERLRVVGFTRDGVSDPALWRTWMRQDMDQIAPVAHREALALGRSFCIVWAGPSGRPQISVESARQVSVSRDPATRDVLAAVKRWELPGGRGQRAVTYEPDVITMYGTDAAGAPADSGAWRVTGTVPNPLGAVPVVPLVNADRLLDLDGVSEFGDAIPLVDALVKLLSDMLVTSEFYARPRRWATGVEVPVDEVTGEPLNPFSSEADRTWISEAAESKFGQFQATDLSSYQNAVTVVMKQLVATTGLPEHVLGVGSDNPTSADAIRASEAALTARAESKQRIFGRAWEHVARLAVAVEFGTDPASVDVGVQWADPSTRSVAQEADAVTKLVAAGVLPVSIALEKLGYSAADIARIRVARRAEALDASGVDLTALIP